MQTGAQNNGMQNGKQEKVNRAAEMASVSQTMADVMPLNLSTWAGILSRLDEEKVDEFLLILEEERGMFADVEAKAERKREANRGKYLQLLENLKITMEQLPDNPS